VKIEILAEAKEDLLLGYHFYEAQSPGLGSYFLDSLFSDIDSLLLCAGIHRKILVRTDASPVVFRSRFITASRAMPSVSALFLIADAIRR